MATGGRDDSARVSPHGIRVDASSTASPWVMVSRTLAVTLVIFSSEDCGMISYRFVGCFGCRIDSLDFRSFVA